ncbi:MAG: DUF1003 domain-containing protein [Caldimonas sp.]
MRDPDPVAPAKPASPAARDLLPSARENLEQLNDFQDREDAAVTRLQASIEAVSKFFGSSAYFVFVVVFIVAWVAINTWGAHAGWEHYDKPPFFWLQGLVSANALLLTVAVLIRQNRMAKQSARRAHLDLHINLLTEEKVSKVLQVVHDLAKELGKGVGDEGEIQELTTASDPEAILTAIKNSERDGAAKARDAAAPTPPTTPKKP